MGKTTVQIDMDFREKLEHYQKMIGFKTHNDVIEFLLYVAAKNSDKDLALLNYEFRKEKYGKEEKS